MLKTLRLGLYASVFTLAATDAALAGPLVAGVGAFIAALGPIGQLVLGVALNFVAQAVTSLFGPKPQQQERKAPGAQLRMTVGGDNPLSFPLGPYATAGTRVYCNSFGTVGGTPNALFVDVIAVSDLPISGFNGFWVNDERVTLGDTPHASRGFPVLQYRRAGKDHMWILPFDGTQTTASSYLTTNFGSDPNYPFTSDMIGRGVAYFVVTTLLPGRDDRDLISQPPRVLAEVGSILLYDPRKDSSVGGSGAHRWDNPSTWEPSANRIVQAYNVARGVHYVGDWIFGGQNWPAFRLPLSSWIAAMNACDLAIDLDGGGTEPQFHGGGMVEVDTEPATVLEELFKSCSGLIAEVGGVYKVRVGAPGVPVMSFTDDDIIVTREQGYRPFNGLEETYNTVNWTYSEPGERWANKEGPEYRDTDLVAADDGRVLPLDFSLPWVQSNTTGQRIVKAALKNSRRFATHVHYLPPQAWLLEPLDTVSWSSARNGYDVKEFDIEEISGGSDFMQMVRIRENDPEDYDWAPETDEQPYSIETLVTIRPAPQPMTGWQVEPATFFDADNNARRPTMEISYASALEDVGWIRVQVRLTADETIVFEGEVPYDAPYAVKLNGVFIGNTEYQARGKYVPYSTRQTEWSSWLDVTTPDIPDAAVTDIQVQQLGRELQNAHEIVTGDSRASVQAQFDFVRSEIDRIALAALSLDNAVAESMTLMEAHNGAASAAIVEHRKALAELDRAFAQLEKQVIAIIDDNIASGYLSMTAEVNTEESIADILFKVRAIKDGLLSQAALIIRAAVGSGGQTTSQIGLLADALYFLTAEGDWINSPFSIVDGEININAITRGPALYINPQTGDVRFG